MSSQVDQVTGRGLGKAGAQVLRGFCMGAADIVPGVSGGTVALLFGIYQELVAQVHLGARALGQLVRLDVRGAAARLREVDWLFLVPLLVGVLGAVASLASIIDRLLEDYPEEMAGLFFGLVAASVVVAWGMVGRWDAVRLGLMAVVAVVSFVVLGLSSGAVTDPSLLVFLGSGAVAICAMILPGISGSFILLMLGMYGAVLDAVNERQIDELGVFVIGCVVGLALFSSLLGWALRTHHDTVMAAIVGLLIGSLRVLWPWPDGVGVISDDQAEVVDGTRLEWPPADELLLPVVLAVVAFTIVLGLTTAANHEPSRHGR